jgi:hypothetical protein
MAVAVEIRHTSQSPTCWQCGSKRAANKNVVIQIPDRCLTRRGIVKDMVWFPVAVNVGRSYQGPATGRTRPSAPPINIGSDKYQMAVWRVAELNKP